MGWFDRFRRDVRRGGSPPLSDLRVFKVRVFVVERPGGIPGMSGVVYAVAADEYAALAYVRENLPKDLRGGDLGIVEEVPTDLPLWTVRVGVPEPGWRPQSGRPFRAAAMSWYRLVGAKDREVLPELLRVVCATEPHRLRMIENGWVEVSEEPLRLDRESMV